MEEDRDGLRDKVDKLEAQLLEQEHRPYTLIKNYVTRKKWSKDDPRRSSVKVALLWRLLFSPAAVAATGGFIGIISLLFIFRQNQLFEEQNRRIEQQTHLIEAGRRSAQVFLLGELLSDIGEELKGKEGEERKLTPSLVGRVISLSQAMKPYKYLDGDTLIGKKISPERGQLFLALEASSIDSTYLVNSILSQCNFNYIDLGDETVNEMNFQEASVLYGNFYRFSSYGANFNASALSWSNFQHSNMALSNFSRCSLFRVDFKDSDLRMANFTGTSPTLCDFRSTNLEKCMMVDSKFNLCDMSFSTLENVNFSGSVFKDVNFYYSNLTNVDFSKVKIKKCSFHGVRVGREDWLSYVANVAHSVDDAFIDKYRLVEVSEVINEKSEANKSFIVLHKDSSSNVKDILSQKNIYANGNGL